MTDADDQKLIAAAQSGDRAALERLLERYAPIVLGFGRKLCGDDADANEVLQDTLWAASQHVGDFRGDAALSSWLYSVARNFCLRRRRRAPMAPLEHDHELKADAALDPEQALAHKQLRDMLEQAVATLSPEHQQILLLRDAEERPAAEVAAMLGLSVEAVKSRLHRARAAVGEALRGQIHRD